MPVRKCAINASIRSWETELKQGHEEGGSRYGELKDPEAIRVLEAAACDLRVLLDRGYKMKASLGLVGDRYQLTELKRKALMRALSLCPGAQERMNRKVDPLQIAGSRLGVDGFNVLITLQAWLSGFPLIRCADGCLRDILQVGGRFRRTEVTEQALIMAGRFLDSVSPEKVEWVFDAPVSRSGELCLFVEDLGRRNRWPWEARTAPSPDGFLAVWEGVVATSDAALADRAPAWTDLAALTVMDKRGMNTRKPWIVDFLCGAWDLER